MSSGRSSSTFPSSATRRSNGRAPPSGCVRSPHSSSRESPAMTTPLRQIVVVGNGIAGLTAADSLRAHGFDGELTIVGAESRPAYSRPALSKGLLRIDADLTAHDLPAP